MKITTNDRSRTKKSFNTQIQIKKSRKKYLELVKKYILVSSITDEGLAIHQKGRIIESNKKFATLLGYQAKEMLGIDIKKSLQSGMVKKLVENPWSEIPVILPKVTIKKKDGSFLKCSFKLTSIKLGNKRYHCMTVKDIAREERIKSLLKQNQEKYKIILEHQSDLINEMDPEGNFLYVSPSYCKFCNRTEEALVGKNIFTEIENPKERNTVRKSIEECLKPPYQSFVEQKMHLNGEERIFHWINKAVLNNEKEIISIIGVGRDITEIRVREEKIKYLSFHDKLTGLYNRAFFEEELLRLDTDRQLPLSIIMGDVNSLKLINDAFGHEKGDELLKKCAALLNSCIRQEDIAARWGGDEFAVILPRTTNMAAEKLVNRIIKKGHQFRKQNIPISMSFGVATKTSSSQNIKDKINKAEDSMYKRKLSERKSLRSSIMSSLERALFEKSHETEEHCVRIEKITTKVGELLKLPFDKIDDLIIFSRLHDIGKVAIPDAILLKIGSLNKKEWEIIKKHPEIGYNICQASPQLAHIAEYVLYHHERWDGTGYPQGLKSTQIPLLSRILSVADAFDVMTHSRNYRQAVTKNEALEEILRCSGTQFDPKIVKIMLSIFD